MNYFTYDTLENYESHSFAFYFPKLEWVGLGLGYHHLRNTKLLPANVLVFCLKS